MTACPRCKSAYVKQISIEPYYERKENPRDVIPRYIHYKIFKYKCLEKCGLNFEFKYKLYRWRINDKDWVRPSGGYQKV